MNGRAVLILGGGVMQVPAIEAARRLSCVVHLADGNPECIGRELVDRFHHVDLRDIPGLITAAQEISGLQGVFTAGTDFSYSVAMVAESCSLPGTSPGSARNASDKGLMRDVLRRHGIPVPAYLRVDPAAAQALAAGEFPPELPRFPLVVKPVDNMGARGVMRCDCPESLPAAVAAALTYGRNGSLILEELIDGQEYSLDAVIFEGEIRITGIATRHIFFPPYFIEMGHSIPSNLSRGEKEVLEGTFRESITALGITRGAAKGDIFLKNESAGPAAVVGEVAARLSGGYMSGWTYPAATGVPLTEIGLRIALGETPEDSLFQETPGTVVTERALLSAPGTVQTVHAPEVGDPTVVQLFIRCAPGDEVTPPANNVEKVANVITRGATLAEAERSALATLAKVVVRLLPNQAVTSTYLFSQDRPGISGGADFSWYRAEPAGAEVTWPWVQGAPFSRGTLLAAPVPVIDRRSISGLISRFPVPAANLLLEELVRAGTIELVKPPAADGAAALDRAFWQPFFRAGLQGVYYLLDSLEDPARDHNLHPWENLL